VIKSHSFDIKVADVALCGRAALGAMEASTKSSEEKKEDNHKMKVQTSSTRSFTFLGSLVVAAVLCPAFQTPAAAQYVVTNLDSNGTNAIHKNDADLINAWGVAYFPGAPFWVSDEGTGKSTLYDGAGNKQSLVVTIPPASGTGHGSPTGMVANGTSDFVITGGGGTGPAFFIFDTLDGTISGWNGGMGTVQDAVIKVNRPGSVYTGLAMGFHNGANFLYAADNGPNRRVDMFDGKFKFVKSFSDSTAPAALAPYNIQNINGYLYVTYGKFGVSGGLVDIFTTGGVKVGRFTMNSMLNAPWGLALAPPNFGPKSNALLVGNLGDGHINAFDYTTHAFLGQLKDTSGHTIAINGLWALTFGGSSTADGQTNQLFFSAGPNRYADGLFGVIVFKRSRCTDEGNPCDRGTSVQPASPSPLAGGEGGA